MLAHLLPPLDTRHAKDGGNGCCGRGLFHLCEVSISTQLPAGQSQAVLSGLSRLENLAQHIYKTGVFYKYFN